MAVYFSGASISETGGINGNKGDQTGGEVRTTKAYMHKLGWKIFRHPNANVAKWIGTNAKSMADNNCFGYGQADRTSGYIACKNAGWEPKNVKTLCNVDCSELVRTCIACAMEKDISDFNTSSEPNVLLGLGFKEITNWTLDTLQLGDIACTKTKGHTEVVSFSTSQNIQPSQQPTTSQPVYRVKTQKRGWLPEVVGATDYAGVENDPIVGIAIKGTSYQVYCGGRWLQTVNGYNINDINNGWAGDGKNPITAIYVDGKHYKVSTTKSVGYYPSVYGRQDFAGDKKYAIDKIVIWN